MSNLFWPVFKNLEKEVIDLSYNINFDDNQFEYIKDKDGNYIKTPPYSVKIGDLLVRCCTEIEALIQELTKGKDENVKKTPSVDSDSSITTGCRLKFLNHIWSLDKKVVYITCVNMFFKKEKNKSFIPFKYKKDGYDDYYSAYNAIKHNRSDITIYKGNIRHLLKAMGSLFLLNLYYKDEPIFLGRNSSISFIPLFSVGIIQAAMTENDNTVKVTLRKFEETVSAVYVIKTTKEYKAKQNAASEEYTTAINNKILELKKNNPDEDIQSLRQRSFQLVSQTNFIKTFDNSEYEIVTIKPENISFYESQGCLMEYTKEQLEQLKKDSEDWKSKIII